MQEQLGLLPVRPAEITDLNEELKEVLQNTSAGIAVRRQGTATYSATARRSHSPSVPHESSHTRSARSPHANAARRTAGNLATPTASPTWATVVSARTAATAIVAHWP
ncbi:hypothetical protein [Streptomyces sp. NPDC002550]